MEATKRKELIDTLFLMAVFLLYTTILVLTVVYYVIPTVVVKLLLWL